MRDYQPLGRIASYLQDCHKLWIEIQRKQKIESTRAYSCKPKNAVLDG